MTKKRKRRNAERMALSSSDCTFSGWTPVRRSVEIRRRVVIVVINHVTLYVCVSIFILSVRL